MFPGFGTLVNVGTIIVGTVLGVGLGHRLNQRQRDLVTSILGLITLVIGGFAVASAGSAELKAVVGSGVLVVLGSLLVGGLLGSAINVDARLVKIGDGIKARFGSSEGRFTEGFVTASLLFCVGPLAILGSLSDGLGAGSEQLLVKSVMDGFAALVFASTLGWGVLFSALVVAVYQGAFTLVGALAGSVMPVAQVDALTATGGVILLALGLGLLDVKRIPVSDLLPALLAAPLIVWLISLF